MAGVVGASGTSLRQHPHIGRHTQASSRSGGPSNRRSSFYVAERFDGQGRYRGSFSHRHATANESRQRAVRSIPSALDEWRVVKGRGVDAECGLEGRNELRRPMTGEEVAAGSGWPRLCVHPLRPNTDGGEGSVSETVSRLVFRRKEG